MLLSPRRAAPLLVAVVVAGMSAAWTLPGPPVRAATTQATTPRAAAPSSAFSVPSCLSPGQAGDGVSIRWQQSGVRTVQLSQAADFGVYVFTKKVAAAERTTTAPAGFAFFGSGLTIDPNTTYYARTVTAHATTDLGSFTVPSCNAAPAPPATTTSTCRPGGGSALTASWTDRAVTSLQLSAEPTFGYVVFTKTVASATLSTTVPDGFTFFGSTASLSPGTTYYLRIFNGSFSTPTTITTPRCEGSTTVSSLPGCLRPGETDTGITTSWSDPGVRTVEISTNPTFANFVFAKPVPAGTTSTAAPAGFSFFDSALTLDPNTTYYVQAVDGANMSTAPSATFTVPSCNPAPAAAVVTVPGCIGYGYTGDGVQVSWPDSTVTEVEVNVDATYASPAGLAYLSPVAAGTTSTVAPAGFASFRTPLAINPDVVYFARVYNGSFSAVTPFSVPACSPLPVPPTVPTPLPGAKRIEIIGDSITAGDTYLDSYRRPLWHDLADAGMRADFVGTLNRNFDLDDPGNLTHLGLPPNPDFDLDSDGHFGYTAALVLSNIRLWAGLSRPDYAVIDVGSNDMTNGQSATATATALGGIIDGLRAVNPRVRILLSNLTPAADATRDAEIQQLNPLMPGLAKTKNTGASPVRLVDLNSGFDPIADTIDGLHPNAAGETFIAGRLFTALRADWKG